MPHATAADGVRLHYETHGEGPPIVMVHELAGTGRSFDLQVAAWQARFQCVTFNARGYPPSEVPKSAQSYSQDLAARDIAAVMDCLGIDSAHVMGVSMGSAAALHLALDRPGRARSVILCSIGSGSDLAPGAFAAEMEARAAAVEASSIEKVAAEFGASPSRRKLSDKNPQEYRNQIAQLQALSLLGLANTMRGVQMRRAPLYAHKDRIAALHMPALVIYGEDDPGCVKPSHFLKETLPGARLEGLAGTGHGVNLEEPAQVNDLVERFVLDIEAQRRRR